MSESVGQDDLDVISRLEPEHCASPPTTTSRVTHSAMSKAARSTASRFGSPLGRVGMSTEMNITFACGSPFRGSSTYVSRPDACPSSSNASNPSSKNGMFPPEGMRPYSGIPQPPSPDGRRSRDWLQSPARHARCRLLRCSRFTRPTRNPPPAPDACRLLFVFR